MNFLPSLLASSGALQLLESDPMGTGSSGSRTAIAALITLSVLGLTIWIGTAMGRGARS
jgi:hypothetical protein